MSKLVRGDQLPSDLRRQILSRFIYRWTSDNPQRESAWRGKETPTIPLISDTQWLRDHAFYVTDRGALDKRRSRPEPAFMIEDNLKNHATKKIVRGHATKKSPAQLQREIDETLARTGRRGRGAVAHYNIPMKWSAWSADRDTWNEYPEGSGFLHSLDALGEEGTAVEVTTSSSKEGRHGKIKITGEPGAYHAVGHFSAELDDGTIEHVTVNETARSINKLLAAVDAREQKLIDAMQ